MTHMAMSTALTDLRIDANRLAARLDALGAVGAIAGGDVSRLALTGEDRDGRDRVAGWMRELGLAVTIDGIGNVVGVRPRAMSVGFTLLKT
jgi:beta-ureidopropionase / N-carbamoyl-L-amino-acid hydrolase